MRWRLHRSVVVRSVYFQRMLSGDWNETKQQDFTIP